MKNMKKMKDTARVLDVICRISKVCMTVGIVACFVGLAILLAAWIFSFSPDQIGTGYESLEIGMLEIAMTEGYVPAKDLTLTFVGVELVLACLCLFAFRFAVGKVQNILSPMKEGAPFASAVAVNLKKLAVYAVVIGILTNLMHLAESLFLVHGYHVDELLLSDKVHNVMINYNLDMTFLLIAAMLLLLSYVFHYGQELQTLSDETL